MRVAIMQPYFLPYIGYFQLIGAADIFIIYDNIKYTKKGWINRNRMLQNGTDAVFSLPLKKDSDALDVVQRYLAIDFNRAKLLKTWQSAYARAPYFSQTFPLLERIVYQDEQNLFHFIHYAILQICAHLELHTDILRSSEITIDHTLKSEERVLALCEAVGADVYVNAIGGIGLYSKNEFSVRGIDLNFIRSKSLKYPQFNNEFVPWLSIVDVLMFNSIDAIQEYIANNYDLI